MRTTGARRCDVVAVRCHSGGEIRKLFVYMCMGTVVTW